LVDDDRELEDIKEEELKTMILTMPNLKSFEKFFEKRYKVLRYVNKDVKTREVVSLNAFTWWWNNIKGKKGLE